MQIGKLARVFCTGVAQNGGLKYCWVMGVLSAIRPDGTAEVMNPIPFGPDGTLDTISPRPAPGPYVCDHVIQIGDWVRACCTEDKQNGERKGHQIQGLVSFFRPNGMIEILSPFYPDAPGPYICNQVWSAPDQEKGALSHPGYRKFIQTCRQRLLGK